MPSIICHSARLEYPDRYSLTQGIAPIYSFLLANTSAVMQLALPDHQNTERKKLRGSDSIYTYASPNATRDRVYHRPMPLMVSLGTPAWAARRTNYVNTYCHLLSGVWGLMNGGVKRK